MTRLLTIALVLLSTAACDKDKPAAAEKKAAGAAATAPAPADPMGAYFATRKALAADDFASAQAAAGALAKAGDAALAGPAANVAKAADIKNARLAFGPVSKALLGELSKDPAKGEGLTAYKCGMYKGYDKWVQKDKKMGNPYWGSKMLECGEVVALAP